MVLLYHPYYNSSGAHWGTNLPYMANGPGLFHNPIVIHFIPIPPETRHIIITSKTTGGGWLNCQWWEGTRSTSLQLVLPEWRETVKTVAGVDRNKRSYSTHRSCERGEARLERWRLIAGIDTEQRLKAEIVRVPAAFRRDEH
ncbi:hypothetical protein JCGZ_19814 [Jatropha curcas]|uniref:Uncharacterized protein n=1 Tax=Jatropha curcas TaxID=180498 RepID=A0A067JXC0_JATCU|nr:hypothetical protein JCGZ_19814 [Jatropha curcas]